MRVWPFRDWVGVKRVKDGYIINFNRRAKWFTKDEVAVLNELFTSELGQINCHDMRGFNKLIDK